MQLTHKKTKLNMRNLWLLFGEIRQDERPAQCCSIMSRNIRRNKWVWNTLLLNFPVLLLEHYSLYLIYGDAMTLFNYKCTYFINLYPVAQKFQTYLGKLLKSWCLLHSIAYFTSWCICVLQGLFITTGWK